jgi:glyoxylase-like metal-dependent hydrolase (beta-lactamase superfamily II)/cyclophilin family peptidyl-prolyl cis-trans isomerase
MSGSGPLHTRRDFLRASAACGAHLALLASASPLAARRLFGRARGRVVAQEPWGRIEQVGDGVWALISTPLQDRTTLCNGGIVRGRTGVLVVEAFGQPAGASWLARQARELAGRWPDQVLLTHYHGDHTAGITGFVEDGAPAAPAFRMTEATRGLVRAADSRRPEPPPAARTALLDAATILVPTSPTSIDLGGRTVRVLPRDGHTRSDVTIELDEPNVVFCGDLVWNAMFPNYVDAMPSRLATAVDALVRSTAATYVPGHGPLADDADLRLYVEVIAAVERAARDAHGRGVSAAEAAASFRLPPAAGDWTLFSPRYFETAIGAWLRELQAAERLPILLDPTHAEWAKPAPPVSRVRFETTRGPFVLELTRAWAPHGVDRFYNLVRLGYYDDTRFHRVSAGYIAQFALSGDPAITAAWRGHELPDDPPRSSNTRGTFAFAQKGPDTRLTQVYINLGDNTRNDDEPFSMLGTVVEGMEVLDRLYSGYGEESGSGMRQGRQGPIETGGNEYLDREFPLLDRIVRACVIAPVSSC